MAIKFADNINLLDNNLINAQTIERTGGRINIKAEGTATVAQFANYGLFLLNTASDMNLYVSGSMTLGYSQSNPEIRYTNGDLRFRSGSGTERMRITSGGQVGIGTSSPASGYSLDINGPTIANQSFRVRGTETGNPTPVADNAHLSGYGLIGNRGTVYLTNASGGTVQIGVGVRHNADPVALFGSNITHKKNTYFEGSVFIANDNTKLTQANTAGVLRVTTQHGWVSVGPANSSWAHFDTDRASFWFSKRAEIAGEFVPYFDSSHKLGRSDKRWLEIHGDSIYQNGVKVLSTRAEVHSALYSTGGSANDYTQFGIYRNYGEEGPIGGHNTILNVMQSDGNYGFQLGANTTSSADGLYYRGKDSVVNPTWYQVASRDWVANQGYMTPIYNGAGDNGGKADFAVGVGGSPQVSWYQQQVQIGGTDMNWAGKIYHNGAFRIGAWDSDMVLFNQGGSTAVKRNIKISPQAAGGVATERVRFDGDGYTYFHGLDLAISNTNSSHGAGNYLRGDSTHLVIGTGGTLHLNYSGSTGILHGTSWYPVGHNNSDFGNNSKTWNKVYTRYVGRNDCAIFFEDTDAYRCVRPADTTVGNSDGLISLGWSNNRWKDLYLSGQANVQKLKVEAATNGVGAQIEFNDNVPGGAQRVYLTAYHADGASHGGGASLHLSSTEPNVTMVSERYHSIQHGDSSQWAAAYSWGNHANAGYLTSVLSPQVGDWWNGGFVKVGTDGVMEVGKYLDFHESDTGTSDYDYRMYVNSGTMFFQGAVNLVSNTFNNHLKMTRSGVTRGLTVSGNDVLLDAGGFVPNSGGQDLGRSDKFWNDFYQAGVIRSHKGDTGTILQSYNSSATGSPAQFYIRHNYGNLDIANTRGTINFETTTIVEGTLYVGNNIQHWGDGGTGMYFDTDLVDLRTQGVKRLILAGSDGRTYFGSNTNKGYIREFANNTYGSQIGRISRITFTGGFSDWDGGNHAIESKDINGYMADSMSINSYNDVTIRLDSNNNNATSHFYITNDTLGSAMNNRLLDMNTGTNETEIATAFIPYTDRLQNLGRDDRRWQIVFCETLDSAGQHESNLQDEEQPISQYATGTVLSWKDGKNRPCTQYADHMRMGIAVHGQDSPLIQGAEPVLVTGRVEEGDYLVTSKKEGHAIAIPRNIVKEQMLWDCVIGKALENGDGESHLIKTWINI